MEQALAIEMVRENLTLAMALWTGVKKGLITRQHLPTGRAVVTSAQGRAVEVSNLLDLKSDRDLERCISNQVRGAFAFSAMHTHRVLESCYGKYPLREADPDLRGARCTMRLLNDTLGLPAQLPAPVLSRFNLLYPGRHQPGRQAGGVGRFRRLGPVSGPARLLREAGGSFSGGTGRRPARRR